MSITLVVVGDNIVDHFVFRKIILFKLSKNSKVCNKKHTAKITNMLLNAKNY